LRKRTFERLTACVLERKHRNYSVKVPQTICRFNLKNAEKSYIDLS